jgi:hypothetical protein
LGGALGIGGGVLSTMILIAAVMRRESRLLAWLASQPEPTPLPVAAHAPSREPVRALEPVSAVEPVSALQMVAPSPLEPPPLPPLRTPHPTSHEPPSIPVSAREVVESAVTEVHAAASNRQISFRAEIGPAWDFQTGVKRESLAHVIAGILSAIIDSAAAGSPVTLSCLEQPARIVRLQFQFSGDLLANQLPGTLLGGARSLPGCCIRGAEPGILWLEFPFVSSSADLAALQNAASDQGQDQSQSQSNMGVASPV